MTELQLQNRLLTPFLPKTVPPIPEENERPEYPTTLNPLSYLFFWWLHPVMRVGYKRTLEPADMFTLNEDIKVETLTRRFQGIFKRRLDTAQHQHVLAKIKQRSETSETSSVSFAEDVRDLELLKHFLTVALFLTFKWQYSLACIFLVLASVGLSTAPLLSKKLIEFVELRALGADVSIGSGVGYALGSSFLVLVIGLLLNHTFQKSMLTGAQTNAVLVKAILDKSFRLNGQLRHDYPVSKITSIMSTDLARIDFALGFQPFLVSFPVAVGITIGILCDNIGAPAMRANKFTDSRVNYMKEVLSNLKMIKFYSWEAPYFDRITENRTDEMHIIFNMQMVRNTIVSVATSLTLFASMASFLVVYATLGSTQSPAEIFSSVSLFNSLTQQVFMLPLALSTAADAAVGIQRVAGFLAAEETDTLALETDVRPEMVEYMDRKKLAVKISNATFKWDSYQSAEPELTSSDSGTLHGDKLSKSGKHVPLAALGKLDVSSSSSSEALEATIFDSLRNIDLEIRKGEFIAITGLIGTGKSSLLNAIAGFMSRKDGAIDTVGSLLLCGAPWIQNTTVKENILFGSPLDEKRYQDVVYACSLESDLKILPAGDQTEIGERGITLSGGQKARINLARAVYADKDIILMDDVLSAVDARVGKHIVNSCLMTLMAEKTRILATHQLSLIGDADRIVFLKGDGTIEVGLLDDLQLRVAEFRELMAFNARAKDEEEDEENVPDGNAEKELIAKQLTRQSTAVDEEKVRHDYDANKHNDGRLIMDEARAVNAISFDVVRNYIKYGSGVFKHYSIVPLLVLLTMISVFCQLFTNTWLSFWTELKFPGKSNGFYIGFYVMFTILAFVFITIQFLLLTYMTIKASKVLHIKAVEQILRVPMSYMDTTPMGRIINRFTKDTDTLDNEIGNQFRMVVNIFSTIVGVLILCVIYLPWFAIAIPALVAIFIVVSNFYQASAREVKRLEAVQRSLVYNNFNETLGGMETIKAYKKETMFIDKNSTLINRMNESYYITIANQRWLAIHLDFVATILVIVISLLCVFRVFDISASSVGLLLSYVLQIAGQLSLLVRMFTQLENEFNSVERLSEYAFRLPQEAPALISETTPHESWPDTGMIRFENASLAYRPGLPLVLKSLNMDVKPREKIGVCGRTGAGKSSIMAALYRLSELESGKIEIDGIDISQLGLHTLRSKLSIIPQDPVLFKGTIRKNLDPFGESSEEELWTALTRAGLIESGKMALIKAQAQLSDNLHKFHLEREVDHDGANFSLGERQLISFARALVRGSKILILDEATSSVDYETDSKIQSTIVREFEDCTILCIAHRLKTILHYDRILVLDKGEIKEFDTPWNLFTLKDSIFQQMCSKSNIVAEDFLERE
ncbi:hypothetical protein METBIDRAFT_9382 [Metschnikowia bicuspidata var. bicuspidata NRRL YB-4993]|uniref:P-loop containing nucleoside triphosphate hydrolase protein n=1 Tax=Metschnikowia bicuspidata var. bicuspidata NRRL YB-4993 TaxID=869754 RepID=A0A1A0HGE7_9ASCO|nr:hypothetical protein METBIDRAFT_9382 [Metschnikowia bicuspidata var. bicuspidata NRRL YB-4993]OBA23065.1 hypothetical protein METBIDRAFT_9382 [Metschnikowia bicuspidata var. bicuspidata NRRL YB-4993]